MTAKSDPWRAWLDGLTSTARAALTGTAAPAPAAADADQAAWRDSLTTPAAAAVAGLAAGPADAAAAEAAAPRYCLVEAHDSAWPVLRGFRTPEALTRRLAALEGQDVVVFAVYGVPLTVTRGPQRYLLLPDGSSALPVPRYPHGPVQAVDASLVEGAAQEDGFLGDPVLANTELVTSKFQAPTPPAGPATGKGRPEDRGDDEPPDPSTADS